MSRFATLFSTPYYDPVDQVTKNILTLSQPLEGPLAPYIQRTRIHTSVSSQPYRNGRLERHGCLFALRPMDYIPCCVARPSCSLLETDELPHLFAFLAEHGYVVDTSLTKMMHLGTVTMDTPIVAFVRYPA